MQSCLNCIIDVADALTKPTKEAIHKFYFQLLKKNMQSSQYLQSIDYIKISATIVEESVLVGSLRKSPFCPAQ